MVQYNFLDDNFTTFENVETPKVLLEMPLTDDFLDISDWSSRITENGTPIVKNNVKSKLNINNTEEIPINPSNNNSPTENYSFLIGNSQKENALYIMDNLINRGFNPHLAAGIVGNLMLESGLNTGAYNPNDLGLPGGGLAGWRGSNFSRLKTFANNQGKSWKDMNVQLDYLISQIDNNVKSRLNNATNPHEASEAWAYYERYAGYDGTTKTAKKAGWNQDRVNKEHKKRSNNANKIYELWKKERSLI